MTIDDTALRAELDDVTARLREAFTIMWRAMQEGTRDEYADALATWQRLNVEHDTLTKAGVLVTLGPLETPRND